MGKGVVGVDLGGTGIKTAAVSSEGRILARDERPTQADKGAEFVLDRIADAAHTVAEKAGWTWDEVEGIGVGIPAFLDIEKGFVEEAVNLGWKNLRVGDELARRLGQKVFINNDANLAALGESWIGGGAGHQNVIAVTLGTGVGGGIIIEGRLYSGTNGMAGEIGHMVVNRGGEPCNCGNRGCLETESSATAMIREAILAVERGATTKLQHVSPITAKDIFDLARSGDSESLRIVKRMTEFLGYGLSLLANSLNPEVIVIGGGLSSAGAILFDALQEEFDRYTLPRARRAVELKPAQLGNDAGVLGAAKWAL